MGKLPTCSLQEMLHAEATELNTRAGGYGELGLAEGHQALGRTWPWGGPGREEDQDVRRLKL